MTLIELEINELTELVIGAAIRIHREYGPGLLESAYEILLASELIDCGMHVDRQLHIPIYHKNKIIDNAFVVDMLINGRLIVELKAVEKPSPVHARQLETYLKMTGLRVGLLINFGEATLVQGLHRVMHGFDSSTQNLRISV